MSSAAEIRVLTTPQELFAAAGEEVVRLANEAIRARERFTIALSGGSTPKNLYNLLATNARTSLLWEKMFFFWGDERHVPRDRRLSGPGRALLLNRRKNQKSLAGACQNLTRRG